jgi:F0F1-type ATP synthase epsilon subunit
MVLRSNDVNGFANEVNTVLNNVNNQYVKIKLNNDSEIIGKLTFEKCEIIDESINREEKTIICPIFIENNDGKIQVNALKIINIEKIQPGGIKKSKKQIRRKSRKTRKQNKKRKTKTYKKI